jgi:hypothetical protein
MVPTFIDFTCAPPRLKNVALVTDDSVFSGDHVLLGNNASLVIAFEVSEDDLEQTVVSFVGLVSRLHPHEGYSPVTLSINGTEFVLNYTVPGGGGIPQTLMPSPDVSAFALLASLQEFIIRPAEEKAKELEIGRW